MPRSSALRAYRRRVKTSVCRGLKRRTCKGKMGCKYVSGSKRKFCRKSGNTKRYSMSLRKMMGGQQNSGAPFDDMISTNPTTSSGPSRYPIMGL